MEHMAEENGNELYEHFRFVVDKGQSPLRIDKYLLGKIENISRNRLQNSAEAGNILVNDKPVKSNYKVKPNELITILLTYPPRNTEILPEDIPINIIYEDEAIIVVNKPAGMVVHPGHGNFTGTLQNALLFYFNRHPEMNALPFLVHRIDKDTSGILVVAKDEISQSRLARQFFDHSIDRRYLALVWGDFREEEGTITGNIARSIRNRLEMDVYPDGTQGKPAVTHYKVVERFGYVTLVECRLETGRTHQIRAHMKHVHHPLFNDELYGGNKILKGTVFTKYKQFIDNCFKIMPRQALHAKSLGFIHPLSKEYMFFDSFLPLDLENVLNKWRLFKQNNG